ncbi:MAG: type II toxin-antitoxin system RelE/ParE family toxin [Clostridia bacterium]|nr:type II toxin-antitoxin system RelE/ParE family toxin [Clostridia bacterium]
MSTANVIVSPAARNDLIGIRDYISDELANPDAALRILKQLRNGIESLQNMPERGMPLDAILSVHTDYRFLVCGNYRIFYLYEGNSVEIVRVLHNLQDYMRALFP